MAGRVEHYKTIYAKWPESWPHIGHEQGREVLYAMWILGQDYRNRGYLYGSYPPSYVARINALFPDRQSTLHVFSGVLAESEEYWRLDLVNRLGHTEDQGFKEGNVYDVVSLFGKDAFDLIVADPPYSDEDAVKYDTPPLNRSKAFAALAGTITAGGHLVWLDTMWPMHSKETWVTVGRICVVRSTNHRVRLVSIFERV